ncbi:Hypothetical predicted protein [Octopus vulgaris]|uniref:Uncharacterized protein n=2 Tax=Octopus TaxID=6643 RepID=A0AA36BB32_OCTVU|nr:cyclin-dependent kinase 2-interacting protein [Octopus sinensis]CAI9730754.1 Hypothetical predicted protein [Octopus vulgaris]
MPKKKKKDNEQQSSRNISFDHSSFQNLFSPVTSPVAVKPSQGNLTGSERVTKDSAADIYNAILKWNNLNLSGAAIMSKIANCKLQAIFEPSTTVSADVSPPSTTMPLEMEPLCEKLLKTVEAMEKVIHKLEAMCDVYRGLFNLEEHRHQAGDVTETVPFQSWTYKDFEVTSAKIVEAYQKEFELKQRLVEVIAHVPDRNLLMFCTAGWLHEPYVSGETQLLLEALVTETGLK